MATTRARPVDMKLEVVVIGVSDVDRAKAFYEKLGWRARRRFRKGRRLPRHSIYAAQFSSLDHFRQRSAVAEAGFGAKSDSRGRRHRGGSKGLDWSRREGERGVSRSLTLAPRVL